VLITLEGAIHVRGRKGLTPFTDVLAEIEAEALFLDNNFTKGDRNTITMYELPTLFSTKLFIANSFGYLPVMTEQAMLRSLGLQNEPVFGESGEPSGYYGTGFFSGGNMSNDRALYWYDMYVIALKRKISVVCFPPVKYPEVTNIRNNFIHFDFGRNLYIAKAGNYILENGQHYKLVVDFPLGEVL